jgi:hypothetical protein
MAIPQEIVKITKDVGKAGLHAMFPNEFEYYALTLELTNSSGDMIEYLTFPVNPESMSYDSQSLVNIKKTMSGISALDNETFNTRSIQITGTFGRKFKLLINNEIHKVGSLSGGEDTIVGQVKNVKDGSMKIKDAVFDPKLKTGYGTIKILESMIEGSRQYDVKNRSNRLFLYNPALGHNWLVKCNSLHFEQDRTSSNMLWKYNLQFTVIAPMNEVKNENERGSLLKSTGIASLQSGLNTLAEYLRSSVTRI